MTAQEDMVLPNQEENDFSLLTNFSPVEMSLVESSTNMDSSDGQSHPSSSENSFSKNSDCELGFSENISQSLGQAPQNHRISAECNENSWSISGADLNTDSTVTPPGSSIVNASHGGLTSIPYGYHRPTQTLLDPMIVNASHGGASSYHYTCHPATLTPLDSRLLNALHGGLVSRPYACQQQPPSYVTLHNNSLNFNNCDFYTAQSDKKDPSSERKKEPISCKCKCKSTKCLKLYCDCFGQGSFCDEDCMCQQCLNRPEYEEEEVVEARKVVLDRDPHAFSPKDNRKGCACKKSQCKQKYCACFLTGVACSSACRCEDCQNPTGNKDGSRESYEEKHTEVECESNSPGGNQKSTGVLANKLNSQLTQHQNSSANCVPNPAVAGYYHPSQGRGGLHFIPRGRSVVSSFSTPSWSGPSVVGAPQPISSRMIYSNPSTWASREVGSSSMFRPNPAMTNNQLCPSNMCSCGCSDPASMHYNFSLSTTPAGGVWSPPISSTPTGFVTPNLYNSGTRIGCPPSDMVAASAASAASKSDKLMHSKSLVCINFPRSVQESIVLDFVKSQHRCARYLARWLFLAGWQMLFMH